MSEHTPNSRGSLSRSHPDLDARHQYQRFFRSPAPWLIDRPGYLFHITSACAACALLGGPTSAAEIGGAVVGITAVIRLIHTWRSTIDLVLQPHILLFLAWGVYSIISLSWSAGPENWETELNAPRWLLLTIALWPVVHHRRWLILAVGAGFLAAVSAQLIHLLEVKTNLSVFGFNRMPGRISAWWQPVVGASLLTGALGLSLPAILSRSIIVQIAGWVLSSLLLIGIALTGTRGAWIAATLLLLLAVPTAILLRSTRRAMLKRMPLLALLAVVLGAGVWVTAGDGIRDRFNAGVAEVTGTFEQGVFNTDTGARLAMWQQAARGFAHRPVTGLGAGGYGAWAASDAEERGLNAYIHTHAHGTIPHLIATHGLIGGALFAGFVVLAIRAAASYADDPADLGPALGLVALLLVGIFDTIQVNMQTAALAAALIGMSPLCRPSDTRSITHCPRSSESRASHAHSRTTGSN